MAIKENDKKAPISFASVTTAQKAATPLKAPTDIKYKSEQDIAFQTMMAKVASQDTQQNRDLERWRTYEILTDNAKDVSTDPIDNWINENVANLGQDFDAKDPVDVAHAQFKRDNPNDIDITSIFESESHTPYVVNPRVPSQAGRDKNAPTSIIDDGFKAPTFKLNKEQARTELARDIRTVSEMYAADAGISAKDLAKVMGGIATIESRFGVLRSIPSGATKYASSAGGAFHYLNGTIAGEVRESISDPRIANRVASLGVSIKDGVSKSEAWTLKDDNILAGSILAKQIVETIRKNPELKNDIAALTTRVYQSHNLGEGGARALARGGRQALEALDHKADDNNPMFFKGASSDAEVNSRYTKFVTSAIASANPLIETAFSGQSQPSVVVASAKANLRNPAPEPS